MHEQSTVRQAPRPEDEGTLDIFQLLRTIWRGKWIIGFCAAVAFCIGAYYAFFIAVPKYAATTRLALQVRSERVVDLDSVLSGVSADFTEMNTELQVIRSRKLGEQLVQRLNLTEDPEFNAYLRTESPWSLAALKERVRALIGAAPPVRPEPTEDQVFNATVGEVLATIRASILRYTYVYSITATTQHPGKSAEIVNALADIYVEDQIAVKFEATEKAVAWLSQRVAELETELQDNEDAIADLRASTELTSLDALDALTRQARDMQERIGELRAAALALGEQLVRLREIAETGVPDAIVAAFNDPTLRRIALTLDAGGADARQLFRDRVDLLLRQQAEAAQRAESQAQALEASHERAQETIEQQSSALLQLQQMQREAEATRVLYETFLARLKETSLQRGLQQADSRVLSRATGGSYVEPRKSMILLVSLVAGAVVGLALVLLRHLLHSGFRTGDDLERATGITVMGQIPRLPIRRRGDLVGYLSDKPASRAAEAIRNLRTSVFLSNIDNPPQVIMSTSSTPAEGKTTQAIALAHNIAGMGKKVLLIEGDIRRRTFSQYFKTDRTAGLVSVLTGACTLDEAVFHDRRLGADVLLGERSKINAGDLFSSDRFREFMQRVRDLYDVVVIDTPPVLVVPDARVISQSVDAILYAVRWDHTPRAQVDEGLRQFSAVNIRVTGLVLAQIDAKRMRTYGYGGSYGRYAYRSYGRYYDGA